MILSELIAKLGELYLSQGDVLVHVGDSTIGWDVSDVVVSNVVVSNVPDYVLLVAGPLMSDFMGQKQMILDLQREIARLQYRGQAITYSFDAAPWDTSGFNKIKF